MSLLRLWKKSKGKANAKARCAGVYRGIVKGVIVKCSECTQVGIAAE